MRVSHCCITGLSQYSTFCLSETMRSRDNNSTNNQYTLWWNRPQGINFASRARMSLPPDALYVLEHCLDVSLDPEIGEPAIRLQAVAGLHIAFLRDPDE